MAKTKIDIQDELTEEIKNDKKEQEKELEEKRKAAHREAQKRYRERKKNGEVDSGRENTFDKKEYDKNYRSNNIKRIPLDVSMDFFEIIDRHISETKESRNGFIKRAITETIERDNKK